MIYAVPIELVGENFNLLKGIRKRVRACFPPKNGGKDCPPPESKEYSESAECMERRCIGKRQINSWPRQQLQELNQQQILNMIEQF